MYLDTIPIFFKLYRKNGNSYVSACTIKQNLWAGLVGLYEVKIIDILLSSARTKIALQACNNLFTVYHYFLIKQYVPDCVNLILLLYNNQNDSNSTKVNELPRFGQIQKWE